MVPFQVEARHHILSWCKSRINLNSLHCGAGGVIICRISQSQFGITPASNPKLTSAAAIPLVYEVWTEPGLQNPIPQASLALIGQ